MGAEVRSTAPAGPWHSRRAVREMDDSLGDPLDGDSIVGETDDSIEVLSPDELLERQRSRWLPDRYRRTSDAPPAPRRRKDEPFTPSIEWTRALHAQLTAEARVKVLTYAYMLGAGRERAGLVTGDDWAQEAVHAAIGDTLAGRIRWRFERVSLVRHLKDTIRSRTWKEAERSRRFRHVSIDAPEPYAEEEVDEQPTAVEAALTSRRGRRERDELAALDLQRKVIEGLRAGADDPHQAAILGALEIGLTDKADICAHTGLTGDEYHAARRKLQRRACKLRADLIESAKEALSREAE
jgi:hypothetical protein